MKKLFLVLVLFTLLLPSKIFAWGTTGHRVVAEIAERNISPSTKEKVDQLLDGLPMAYWANWPDFIKSDTTGEWDRTFIWHYVNAPQNLSKSDFVSYISNVKQDNLYSEIPKLKAILEDANSSDEDKRVALIFLIHLVGDAHQPMHVGCEEDLGGNKVSLMWFRDKANLHSIWDGKLIDYEKYSYTEYSDILDVMAKKQKDQLQQGSLEDWLYESHELANEIYSGVNNEDRLSYEYSFKYKDTVENQLQKGGMRLAKLLDDIFNK